MFADFVDQRQKHVGCVMAVIYGAAIADAHKEFGLAVKTINKP